MRARAPLVQPMSAVCVALAAAVAFAAGCFDASFPDGAQVFCTIDDDCPPETRCNVATHLCGADITPPAVISLGLVDSVDNVFADTPTFDTIRVALQSNEPIPEGGASLVLASLTSTECSGEGAVRECVIVVPPAFTQGGAHELQVVVIDAAGNEGTATVDVVIDTTAPRIVDGAVSVDIETAGIATATATTSSVVTIEMVVDEELAAPPQVSLDVDGSLIPLDLVEVAGRRFAVRYDDASVTVLGSHTARAVLTDRFGHTAEVEVADIEFVADGELCPRPAGVTCVDFDGDGAAAASSCAGGNDVDDRDPTVAPGFPELPGDGRDNDGIAGDEPIDEVAGFFVDGDNGDDAGDGSRAAPLRTIEAALAGGAERVFVATSSAPYDAPSTVVPVIIGGLDPATWTRAGGRSVVRGAFDVRHLDGIECGEEVIADDGVIVRAALTELFAAAGQVSIIDSTVGFVDASTDTLIIDSDIGVVHAFAQLSLHRTVVRNSAALFADASLVATSSSIAHTGGPALFCGGCSSITLAFCTVTKQDAGSGAAIDVRTADSLRIAGTSVVSASTFPAIDTGDVQQLSLTHSNVSSPGLPLRIDALDVSVADLADVAAVTAVTADAAGTLADFHLPASSPLRDRDIDMAALGLPLSVVGDIDGECRFGDGAPDVGADEVN